MGNPSNPKQRIGTIGELLTQIRLLEFGVEPAIPLIDSGNDIIAVREDVVKYIQVKTRRYDKEKWRFKNLRKYHILVLIKLAENPSNLDQAKIYLLSKEEVAGRGSIGFNSIEEKYRLSQRRIDELFGR
ncbi:MAG: hypothetical protein QXL94_04755 [Candidatus Parvarchaeum sp.]